jgi:GGDEF domain-containing protein
MTIARNPNALAATPPVVTDGASLLPSRAAVLERLAERLPTAEMAPATLMVLGLLRREDGWPTAQSTLTAVTTLLARSLRGDDWIGKSGPGEFVMVLTGPLTAAEAAAVRLLAAVPDLGIEGLTAAAGLAPLCGDVDAAEMLRRGLASLTAARRVGAGTVIRHRQPY